MVGLDGPVTEISQGLARLGHEALGRVVTDLTRKKAEAALAEASRDLGGLDNVVIVTGVGAPGAEVVDLGGHEWAELCEDRLSGALVLTQASYRHLSRSSHGRLVYVVPSVGMWGAPGYCIAGAVGEGIRALAITTARTWGPSGITVNTVACGPAALAGGAIDGDGRELLDRTVTHRAPPALGGTDGDPESDIAGVIALFASQTGRFVTGQTLVADGGRFMPI